MGKVLVSIRIDEGMRKKIKLHAVKHDMTLTDFLERAVIAAMEQGAKGDDLKKETMPPSAIGNASEPANPDEVPIPNKVLHCLRCGYEWVSGKYLRTGSKPQKCAKCDDPNWDKPRNAEERE